MTAHNSNGGQGSGSTTPKAVTHFVAELATVSTHNELDYSMPDAPPLSSSSAEDTPMPDAPPSASPSAEDTPMPDAPPSASPSAEDTPMPDAPPSASPAEDAPMTDVSELDAVDTECQVDVNMKAPPLGPSEE